jgi:tetratricopeptide (TPR) repeat protein
MATEAIRVQVMSSPAARTTDAKWYAALGLLAMIPYLNTLWFSFVYDDEYQIVDNPYLRSFHYIKQILTTAVWSFKNASVQTSYYRPLMSLEYLVLYQIYGPLAYVFHAANVLTHVAVVLMLFALTRRLFHSEPLALVAAALFAVHPIHTEPVAWVASVSDLQLGFFVLAAFWFYLDMGDSARKRWWTPLALSGSFLLALLSKEPAFMFPVVAVIYEHLFRTDREQTTWREKLRRYSPLLALNVLYLSLRTWSIGALLPRAQRPNLGWGASLLSGFSLLGDYLNKLVWPARLTAFYPFLAARNMLNPGVLAGIAWLLAIAFVCVLSWKSERLVTLAAIWLLVILAPALNARWIAANVFADRYAYLPSVGFCWMVAWGGMRLWNSTEHRPQPRWARVALAIIALSICGVLTLRVVTRNRVWRDEISLYTDALQYDPYNSTVRADLGGAYWNARRDADAMREWNLALANDPKNLLVLGDLGYAAVAHGKYSEAVTLLQRALHQNPNYTSSVLSLARAFDGLHDPADAEKEFKAALASSPLNIDVRNGYAAFCLRQERADEAQAQYRQSLATFPNTPALNALGDIAFERGETAVAERYFEQAAGLDSYDHHAHYQLVRLYAADGREADAMREFQLGQNTEPGTDPLRKDAQAAIEKLQQHAR